MFRGLQQSWQSLQSNPPAPLRNPHIKNQVINRTVNQPSHPTIKPLNIKNTCKTPACRTGFGDMDGWASIRRILKNPSLHPYRRPPSNASPAKVSAVSSRDADFEDNKTSKWFNKRISPSVSCITYSLFHLKSCEITFRV